MISEFKFYNHLGFHAPYYTLKNGKFVINKDFKVVLNEMTERVLDYTAVVEILCTGYAFGDRTLIKNLQKTPWMAKPNSSRTNWEYFDVPRHKEIREDEDIVARRFYSLLEKEVTEYIEQADVIGILLTGGMDSRVIAAVLGNLIKQNKVRNKRIVAYTWGAPDCRDVLYAKRIADIYQWNWQHLKVDEPQMLLNYKLTVDNGCEYTPIHLHAMSKIVNEKLDCVLAGSFGDSVGRAEFSSIALQKLRSVGSRIHNFAGLLRSDFISLSGDGIEEDIERYHTLFPQDKLYQLYEQDMQLHYMRRMLNPCMSIINRKTPLHQVFTAPEVFGFMWSIHPKKRNNLIYKYLLDEYAPELMKIPWARTGLLYPETAGIPDKFNRQHHDYGEMIRCHFINLIEQTISQNKEIIELIFNYKSILSLIHNLKRHPIKGSHSYEERLFWIASLVEFIKEYGIKIELDKNAGGLIDTTKANIIYKAKYCLKRYI